MERRLHAALNDFDRIVDSAVDSFSHQQPGAELVFHTGDILFLFLKGTGSTNPKLRMALTIRRIALAEPPVVTDPPFGVVTRAFDDPPELNRQQNVVFAVDYQRYWVSFFTQPVLVADASSTPAAKGVAENRALVADVPGNYTATLELFDEATKNTSKVDMKFSVIP